MESEGHPFRRDVSNGELVAVARSMDVGPFARVRVCCTSPRDERFHYTVESREEGAWGEAHYGWKADISAFLPAESPVKAGGNEAPPPKESKEVARLSKALERYKVALVKATDQRKRASDRVIALNSLVSSLPAVIAAKRSLGE